MNFENEIYRQLAECPELPGDIYYNVTQAIRHRSITRSSLVTLAASLVIIAGAVPFIYSFISNKSQLRPDTVTAISIVSDYINGDELENDVELDAVVEGY